MDTFKHKEGVIDAIRWWMFLRLHNLMWAVCPEFERKIFKSLWSERLGQWNAELDRAVERRELRKRLEELKEPWQ